jgi:hypothetical protein
VNYYDSNDEKVDMLLMYGVKKMQWSLRICIHRDIQIAGIFSFFISFFTKWVSPYCWKSWIWIYEQDNNVCMWFQQDGVPPHFHRNNRQYLDDNFTNTCIIGWGSNNLWPPRSPDLTPLDFFLWGVLKERVYQTPVLTVKELKEFVISVWQ